MRSVLIIDDLSEDENPLEEVLKKLGLSVKHSLLNLCSSALEKFSPFLVCFFPKSQKECAEGCQKIYPLTQGLSVSIVVFSADQSTATKCEAFLAGCDDYIVIPFSEEECSVRILSFLRRF